MREDVPHLKESAGSIHMCPVVLLFCGGPSGDMQDNEGNEWDIFGNALSGTRVTEQLARTSSFTAFWFAWVAFFAEPEIHAFD